jgi:hypothetical protein
MPKPEKPAGMDKWGKKVHFDVAITVAISDTPSKHKIFGGDATIEVKYKGWKTFENGPKTKVKCEDSVKSLAQEMRTGYGRQHMLPLVKNYAATSDKNAKKKIVSEGSKFTEKFKKTAKKSIEDTLVNYYQTNVLKPYEKERDRREKELKQYMKACDLWKKKCEERAKTAKALQALIDKAFKEKSRAAKEGQGALDKLKALTLLIWNGVPKHKPLVNALQTATHRISSDWGTFGKTYTDYLKAKQQYEKAKPEAKAVYEGMLEGAKEKADTAHFNLVVNTKNVIGTCEAACDKFQKECKYVLTRVDTLFGLQKKIKAKLNVHRDVWGDFLKFADKAEKELRTNYTSYKTKINALITSSTLKEALDNGSKAAMEDYVKVSKKLQKALEDVKGLATQVDNVNPQAKLGELKDVIMKGPAAVKAWADAQIKPIEEGALKVKTSGIALAEAVKESKTAGTLVKVYLG